MSIYSLNKYFIYYILYKISYKKIFKKLYKKVLTFIYIKLIMVLTTKEREVYNMKHGMNSEALYKYCLEVDRYPSDYELWIARLLDGAENPNSYHTVICEAVRNAVDQLGGSL